ncbi:MAG: NAD-dependent succinate-semialdehyde dehydrogenase [Alphaproteobacteria bacterium]|nr:NAD-dependent succinate-semialdehyde dehydrogenase [Alphaproteobacteria bacterium]
MTSTVRARRTRDASWRSLLREEACVGGTWIGAATSAPVRNPADGSVLGHVPNLDRAAVQGAIGAAARALPAWRGLLPRQRADHLMAWRAAILARADDLAMIVTLEQGKPLADARGEILYGAEFVRWFAEEANRAYGDVIPPHLPGRKMLVQREPVGVAALVTPWNFPSAMLTRKAAAALAAGCTAVAAPSMETPFSALALALLAVEAGLPPGVLSVVTGAPPVVVGELCKSPAVRALSFTGSTEIGRLLMSQCAPGVKRLSMELGGHAPFLVFPDVDVEAAAKAAVAAKYQTSGQDCLAANRIYVHADIYGAFIAAFVQETRMLKVGPGTDPQSDIGPVINTGVLDKAKAHVRDAQAKGARVASGGRFGPGLFFEPTVLVDTTPDMLVMQEETFGPVAAITPFTDEAAVVAAANDTEYGLMAYVYTRDLSRAHRLGDALEYGMVAVNTIKITGGPIPFGGVKQSGLGREGSRYGLDEFTELKYVCLAI